jgi:transposase InsO family protein
VGDAAHRCQGRWDAQNTEHAENQIEEVTNETQAPCSHSVRGLRQAQAAATETTIPDLEDLPRLSPKSIVSVDFFVVPTIRFQILYVFLVLAHERRRILHFAVTAHPTVEWTAQQMREAFPWERAPRYLLRDRDRIFGQEFVEQVKAMGIQQVLSAPRSPLQRAYVEWVIGSIRRECLDYVIVFGESSLYSHLKSFVRYYHESRTHLSSEKDSAPRPVQSAQGGRIVAVRQVGG